MDRCRPVRRAAHGPPCPANHRQGARLVDVKSPRVSPHAGPASVVVRAWNDTAWHSPSAGSPPVDSGSRRTSSLPQGRAAARRHLVTRDLKRLLGDISTGGRPDCCTRVFAVPAVSIATRGACRSSVPRLRHSCASLLLAAGGPGARRVGIIGALDVRLTLTNYAHVLDENRAKMAGVIDRVFDTRTDTQAVGRG